MAKQIVNRNFIPDFEKEGKFTKPIQIAALDKKDVATYNRLFSHHTLSSVRHCAFYTLKRQPNDSLDLILSSTYNHSHEIFPDKEDFHLQPETIGLDTWRRLKNTLDDSPPVIIPLGHPIKYGGIVQRRSPHNIKLMNSSHHSAKTAPGYSRQLLDGAVFYY